MMNVREGFKFDSIVESNTNRTYDYISLAPEGAFELAKDVEFKDTLSKYEVMDLIEENDSGSFVMRFPADEQEHYLVHEFVENVITVHAYVKEETDNV